MIDFFALIWYNIRTEWFSAMENTSVGKEQALLFAAHPVYVQTASGGYRRLHVP